MARGILITYPGYPYTMTSLMPDNGLANLAGALFAAGHEVVVIDYGTVDTIRRLFPESVAAALRGAQERPPDVLALDRELERQAERELARIGEELCETVRAYRPDFVGFKLWNGDGCIGSIALARTLRREFPNLKLFAGGPHVTFAVRPIVEHTGRFAPLDEGVFDVVIESEAEELMPRLAEYAVGKTALAGIPNALYRDGGRIRLNPVERVSSLDDMAAPRYDTAVYPSLEGDQKLQIVALDESRGCPYGCNFCIQPLITGRQLRLRSAQSIVSEMERCVREYRISAFRFAGSASPGALLDAIADEILARGLQVRYASFGRVNYSRAESFPRLKQSGLQSLFFGVESGSQRILDQTMNKRANVAQMRRVIAASREAGIFTVTSIIAPAPGETAESWQETLDFLTSVRPDGVPVCPPGPVPGTPWYVDRERYGVRIGEGLEEALLNFKFKLLFPADMWDWPDFGIDGKDSRQIARESTQMIRQIEQLGLLTMFSDEMYLMACHCRLSPREFRDQTQRWLCTGNWEAIAALVSEINGNVRQSARQAIASLEQRG